MMQKITLWHIEVTQWYEIEHGCKQKIILLRLTKFGVEWSTIDIFYYKTN